MQYRSESLHDAAKAGDVAALERLIQEGADVNEQVSRGAEMPGGAPGCMCAGAVTDPEALREPGGRGWTPCQACCTRSGTNRPMPSSRSAAGSTRLLACCQPASSLQGGLRQVHHGRRQQQVHASSSPRITCLPAMQKTWTPQPSQCPRCCSDQPGCAQDDRGITPLGVAVGFNRVKAVTALLEAHADVERTDRQGNTPLHYAAGRPPFHKGPGRVSETTGFEATLPAALRCRQGSETASQGMSSAFRSELASRLVNAVQSLEHHATALHCVAGRPPPPDSRCAWRHVAGMMCPCAGCHTRPGDLYPMPESRSGRGQRFICMQQMDL